jgi:hypothetical protein
MQHRASACDATHAGAHQPGENATHPIEPRCAALAALRILSMPLGIDAVRALPAQRITARSGAFNCRF